LADHVHIKRERKVITYVSLWSASEALLSRGQEDERGARFLFMSSLVFSAFALEAFLNHIGEHVFASWKDLELLPPGGKVNVICERLGLVPDWGALPWQIVPEIVILRNKVAHGKNELHRFEETVPLDGYETRLHEFLAVKWQEQATEANAERVHAQLKRLFEIIHSRSDIEDDVLFVDGAQMGTATITGPPRSGPATADRK
jgi:hypothetical protein